MIKMSSDNIIIREISDIDAREVLQIFEMGIETGNATFEKVAPTWNDWKANHHIHSRFAAEADHKIVGWVALSAVSKREAYKGVAEISIYLHNDYKGRGIGSAMMEKVIESSEQNGIWTLLAVVFPENIASVNLHKKHGFRVIGTRDKISKINGIWRDTLMLERRSRKTGL